MLKVGGVEELALGGVQASLLKLLLALLLVGCVLVDRAEAGSSLLVMFEILLMLVHCSL